MSPAGRWRRRAGSGDRRGLCRECRRGEEAKGREAAADPGAAPPRGAGRAAGAAGRGGWERVLGGGVWKPLPQAAACDDPGGKEEAAGGDRLSE